MQHVHPGTISFSLSMATSCHVCTPQLSCIDLQVFAKGSESHVALAMHLDNLLQVAAEQLVQHATSRRRSAAVEKKLLKKAQATVSAAENAAMEFYEAMFSRFVLLM